VPSKLPGPVDGRIGAREPHQQIDLGQRDREVLGQRTVRLVEQRAEPLGVAVAQGAHRRQHAGVLADHVTGAAVERRRQAGEPRQVRRLELAQLADPQQASRPFALGAPRRVLAAGVAVGDPGVDHRQLDRGGQGHALESQVAGVEKERVPLVAQADGDGVHDADGSADELVLGLLREPRDAQVVDRQSEGAAAAAQQGDRKRGARGQPGARRHRRLDPYLAAGERKALPAESVRHALHVVEPTAPRRLAAQPVLGDGAAAAAPGGAGRRDVGGPRAHHSVRPPADLDAGAQGEGQGQHVAAVVVGVLADEVDPPGRIGRSRRQG
jgi:hypothetical protein